MNMRKHGAGRMDAALIVKNDRNGARVFLVGQAFGNGRPVHVREKVLHQDDVGAMVEYGFKDRVPAVHEPHRMVVLLEAVEKVVPDMLVILHQED